MNNGKTDRNYYLICAQNAVVLILAVILCVYVLFIDASNHTVKALPMSFGIGGAVVITGSMEPAIPVDSFILVKAERSYSKGDIVAYTSGNSVVVHRIIEIQGNSIITKGDANNIQDAPITAEEIKGKVVFHLPYVGYVLRLMKTPFCKMVLLITAFVMLMLSRGKSKNAGDG